MRFSIRKAETMLRYFVNMPRLVKLTESLKAKGDTL